jgi:hypothetical protein
MYNKIDVVKEMEKIIENSSFAKIAIIVFAMWALFHLGKNFGEFLFYLSRNQ